MIFMAFTKDQLDFIHKKVNSGEWVFSKMQANARVNLILDGMNEAELYM